MLDFLLKRNKSESWVVIEISLYLMKSNQPFFFN